MKKLFVFSALVVFGAVAHIALADDTNVCLKARDKANHIKTAVVNSAAEMQVASGSVKGLRNQFCVFTSPDHMGAIDLQTLASKRPSIAATYLLNGLDVASLPMPGPGLNPGTVYCQALEGSSISRYTSGGFLMPGGEDEVCVFGDGSKISIWVLVYVSGDPQYLSMRKAVKSKPLALDLPYMAK